jgi:uncharacterized beta-barrel protein YwiB (DUF1934 family)
LIPVKIWIESTIQHDPDSEPEVIRQEMAGKLSFREEDDEWVIRYTEQEGTQEEVHTSVKAAAGQVTVVRHGSVAYRQKYVPGQVTESVIHTPAGIMEMEVTTLEYRRERFEREGQIRFAFLLNMGDQDLGKYQLNLKWMEESQDESA